jgi:hypothetical protein
MELRAISVLRFCAWINLLVGIAAGVVFGTAAVNSGAGMVTGLISVTAGLSSWAFLLVICSIAESLIEIRTNTAAPAKSRLFDKVT